MSENAPLLPATAPPAERRRARGSITLLVPVVLVLATLGVLIFGKREPSDPLSLARYWLDHTPIIDGHIDLPIYVREMYGNDVTKFDLRKKMSGHVDIPRIREGRLGGFFWSVYADCHEKIDGPDFLNPSHHVRDTLEQIDVARNLMDRYAGTFEFVTTAQGARDAMARGRVASFMGIEGAHQLGNSLGVLRQYYNLGVRYATLTHSCNNAFADSGGYVQPNATWGGLSPFGYELVKEMNRLGMLIDLSHVSDDTARQAIKASKAPIMLSHSAARHFNNFSRNVPDDVLGMIGRGKGQTDGVVMVNFFPFFASKDPDSVDAASIADQIDYIASKTGHHHVGIGSDFDGIDRVPKGLEDVSKYPHLIAELIRRGWTRYQVAQLAGGNILRVLEGAEAVAARLQRVNGPSMAKYSKRHDLDGGWGGFEL
ncbi:microsomal dipeptidase precursor (Dehydropeptidase-I) [Cutaneotrichosporon oleaginosum]|uniref:Dipeptidase n=1 Tax=Cutaneotrichosporon oleaginosum TaxID=879819 RepID=A0A0J1B384_9TREE|nr:microsomal dipeptidase precursor (Dehydropeptidase-I) [Cutaneotrichosporon oleaginosum]KLT42079.1 microsomal dipeptidase precursor (Dehydropeptidase-I) [Cutaneotrichosporon oleaginosum]TXT04682.1 hypothetical protein COLE_07501 [Cutaneotrichosporon oleaginosum]